MIGRHDEHTEKKDIWTRLAEPMGDYRAVEDVRKRLDSVCPGEWDLTLEVMPVQSLGLDTTRVTFKARLQILGVIRESCGNPNDSHKLAAQSAFVEAAKLFGIGEQ